jgi:hypothetical protein
MHGNEGYAVFLFPQALEALDDAIKPYLTQNAQGPHLLCREIDTSGALIQMTLEGTTGEGRPAQLQLMLPSGMVRMIVSARGEDAFGFRPRQGAVDGSAAP